MAHDANEVVLLVPGLIERRATRVPLRQEHKRIIYQRSLYIIRSRAHEAGARRVEAEHPLRVEIYSGKFPRDLADLALAAILLLEIPVELQESNSGRASVTEGSKTPTCFNTSDSCPLVAVRPHPVTVTLKDG